MRVSVLTPTFNRRDYLKETIESFLSQDYEDKEMIIVDDGGTDKSHEVVDGFKMYDSNIKYYRKENGGISSAYNFGLEQATGELICVMQDDDLFFGGNSISNRVNIFNRAENAGVRLEVIWTDAVDIYENGNTMKRIVADPVNAAAVWKGDHIYTESMMWRKSIHERIGGFYNKANEDWDFKIRCVMECQCASIPGIVTAKYRRWGGNASTENIRSGRRDEAEKEFRARLKNRYTGVFR